MEKSEMVWIAKRAIDKNMDFETLKYSDYMYGKESLTDDVWGYVEECREIGTKAFYGKYPD
jgi:hypothetical protein